SDEEQLVALLGRDVGSTLGDEHLDVVRSKARHHRQFADSPVWYVERVVEDVQQYFHDCFIDTTWPTCPSHPNHQLRTMPASSHSAVSELWAVVPFDSTRKGTRARRSSAHRRARPCAQYFAVASR